MSAALWNERLDHHLTTKLANAAIRDAAAQAGGYLALLGAYQVALSQAAPDHSLHLARVRQVIQDAGASTARRTMNLQKVWELDFDPHAIARELQEKFHTQHAQLRAELEACEIEKTWGGFLWGFPRHAWAGVKVKEREQAEALRAAALARLEELTLEDECTRAAVLEWAQAKVKA